MTLEMIVYLWTSGLPRRT